MTVLFVEHDMDMVHDISDWVVVMAEGHIIAEGTPDQIIVEPNGDRRLPRRPTGAVVAGGRTVSDGSSRSAMTTACCRNPTWSRATSRASTSSTAATSRSNQGEFVGIIGPNGAGKSTLLKAMLGLCQMRAGTVRLGERDITGLKAHELVARGRRLRPAEQQRLPDADRPREPGDGLLPRAVAVRRAVRLRHHAVPAARRAWRHSCRRACRAANARWSRWAVH